MATENNDEAQVSTKEETQDAKPDRKQKAETAQEACTRMSSSYQRQFEASVPPLKSVDLLDRYKPDDIVLIDCRTQSERAVSIIQGAIPLDGMDVTSLSKDDDKKDKTIVTYCSVGYRSGLEAERLKDVLGKDRDVFNLDGILAYTHAIANKPDGAPPLINPTTQEATKEVHSFSKQWDCADESYQTKQFSTAQALFQMGKVASHTAVRKTQHAAHRMTSQK